MMYLFISDLHLSQDRPEKLTLFEQMLQGPAKRAKTLYILGDLFDGFWIGCDDERSPNREIIQALKAYSEAPGTKLYILRGNRDFYLNTAFTYSTGAELIDDPCLITIGQQRILLMHGDTLCTDDVSYQIWRTFLIHPFTKRLFSILPLNVRKTISSAVRDHTARTVQNKPHEITDVSCKTVMETMKKHQVTVLIHGHTHRQAVHEVNVAGSMGRRIVLGDWYQKDCVLVYEEGEFRFERVKDFIRNG